MSEAVKIHYQDDTITISTLGPIIISCSTGIPTLAHVENTRRVWEYQLQLLPGRKISGLTLAKVDPTRVNLAHLKAEVRTAMVKMMGDYKAHAGVSGMAFEGTGMVAMAMRAAMSVLMVAARANYTMRAFATAGEAIDWVFDTIQWPAHPAERTQGRADILAVFDRVKQAATRRSA